MSQSLSVNLTQTLVGCTYYNFFQPFKNFAEKQRQAHVAPLKSSDTKVVPQY